MLIWAARRSSPLRGTADSTARGVNVQYFDGLRYDLQVTWAAPDLAVRRESALAAVDGVETFSLTWPGRSQVRGAARALDTLALSLEPGDFVQLSTVAGERAFSRADAIWIGHNLARTLGVSVGDTLELEALGQRQTAVVAGVVARCSAARSTCPRADARLTPLSAHLVNAALVRVADGADLPQCGVRWAICRRDRRRPGRPAGGRHLGTIPACGSTSRIFFRRSAIC